MSTKRAGKREVKFEKEEVKSLVDMFADIMNAYGSFSENLGKIQKTHDETYKYMFSIEFAEKIPEMLAKVTEEGPPELSKLLVRLYVKMVTFLPRIGKIMDLSADEKIKLGKNLKSLANDYRKLLDWVEKIEE